MRMRDGGQGAKRDSFGTEESGHTARAAWEKDAGPWLGYGLRYAPRRDVDLLDDVFVDLAKE